MIPQIYRSSKNQSPEPFDFSIKHNASRIKKPKKLASMNQSIISTRDQSSNRSKTPIKLIEYIKKKSSDISQHNSSYLDDMKKQLDTLFKALPKAPTKLIKIRKEPKKLVNTSFENKKIDTSKIFMNKSKDRARSTFYTKKSSNGVNNDGVSELQKYLFEFHQKSKFLVEQLEKNVLGKVEA